ncbi:MAG: PhzF family phenazine biosynthesis protein [Candidatus Kariarchaeaceae archaeon]
MEKSIYVVNVFSESGIRGGNQLAVVLDASDLDDEDMLAITRQMNYSETTFVTEITDEYFKFRIFVPSGEIPYAGHPTIGTCYILNHLEGGNRRSVIARLAGGDVHVEFDVTGNKVFMEQLPVQSHGEFDRLEEVLEIFQLSESDLITTRVPVYAPSALKFVVIPVVVSVLDEIRAQDEPLGTILHSDESLVFVAKRAEGEFSMRMFAPNQGISEDPATGSAQGAVIRALQDFNLFTEGDLIMQQGYAMSRPSVLYNRVNQDQLTIKTGGSSVLVISGSLSL